MIKSPVLVVGCARSGTTLLYNVLSEAVGMWSIGGESKAIIEHYHHPASKQWRSGALSTEDLTLESAAYILSEFSKQAASWRYWRRVNELRGIINRNQIYTSIKHRGRISRAGSGASSAVPVAGLELIRSFVRLKNTFLPRYAPIRLLEKTPENCLRLPFLAALFPDARVIFLTRDGRANVHSLIEGWRQPHLFPGYETPLTVTSPGQSRGRWAFTLIPGWKDLVHCPLQEIAAHQWVASNEAVLDYAASPESLPMLRVRYEDLVAIPQETLVKIAAFIGLNPQDIPANDRPLPEVNIISRPGAEKWRREEDLISRVASILGPMMARLDYENP